MINYYLLSSGKTADHDRSLRTALTCERSKQLCEQILISCSKVLFSSANPSTITCRFSNGLYHVICFALPLLVIRNLTINVSAVFGQNRNR